ncbi:signal peptide peptidase SppA [Candidatus Poribacteria bacterium]|nr:signal peptide peptidase SppA [Candidatus Poribacteria bacterium]MXY26837.1 signal peptide peptidase SppA [Candidatus Poribacteria bacterium]MYK19408.1 signal peptide peptidase SppA [Candidatus Poribacteria bacterium]
MAPPLLFNHCLQYVGKTIVSAALIYGMSTLSAAAASPKAGTHLPSSSIAVSDDALATFFNPSGLGTGRGLNLYYLRTYQSNWAGDDAFFLAVPNGGFGIEFATADADTPFTRYTLSSGRHLGHSLYAGTSYSWINSDDKTYDTFRSLSLGLMYRRRYFSIGAMARDLNQPKLLGEKLGRTYDLGLAIRPGTWRTTLSLDMQKTQGIEGVDLRYALEVRPIRELLLRGTLNSDLSFDVRFGINIGNWGLGTGNTFDKNRESQTGVGYFHFSNTPTTKQLPRRRMFLDLQMHSLKDVLSIAKSDEDVAGILVRINGDDYGMAQLQEMADAILNFRESGRVVLCYITTKCSTGDYIVASVCDGILIHPFAEVRLIGLRAERSFYKGTLDMLGIRANLEHIGKYKSAAEAFTRKEMSEAQREIQNIILDDLYEQLVDAIAKGRGWTPEDVKKRIDEGPYTALQAFRIELVDRISTEGHLKNAVTELTDKHTDLVSLNEYAKSRLYTQDWRVPQPKIAIIEAKGLMVTGDSFTDLLTGTQVMGADTIVRAIREAKDDDAIKAVVLRIDSGGGLVVAADIIWQALVPLTKIKPVVVSMGDVAASGGYYIAAPANVIVAEPGTITGSIGVIGGKYSLKGLYEKLGIQKEILKRGEHADFYSDYSDYPPSAQEIIRKQIKEVYNEFITKVAAGRSELTTPEVDKLGRGRIWSGRQAKENGLVDELGGLNLALAIAQEYAGLQEKTVEIIRFPKQTWSSQLVNNLRFSSAPLYQAAPEGIGGERKIIELPLIARYGGFSDTLKLINILRQHRLFLLMPYHIAMGQ